MLRLALGILVVILLTDGLVSLQCGRGDQYRLVPLNALDMKKAVDFIHERVVLSEIIGQFVDVKQNGPQSFTCICPFHEDKNPSMGVSDDKGLYHCFSCGAGGDAIKFVREIEHLSFSEAVVKTLSLAGVGNTAELGLGDSSGGGGGGATDLRLSAKEAEILRQRKRLEEAMTMAAQFYSVKLLGDAKAGSARTHLIQRRIRPQTAFKFQLGYAPTGGPFSLTANLTAEGFTIDELVTAGLSVKGDRERTKPGIVQLKDPFAENNFDRFRDRIVVPICNAQGTVVAFGGRLLDGSASPTKPKYLNSPETPIFKKSTVLFGFDLARKAIATEGVAVVVEGYFDVIALHDVGIENAVGSMGTMLTKEQLESAARAGKGKVVLLFDADEAGQTATQRVVDQVLPQLTKAANIPVDLRIAELPQVPKMKPEDEPPKDAADVCVRLGQAAGPAMRTAFAQAIGWKQWSVDRIILAGVREADARIQQAPSDVPQSESPTLAALGLESSNSAKQVSIESFVAAPDVLVKTAAALSRFLGKLEDSADRTILAYYCAERLAGGRTGMRMQLENDILAGAKRHAEFQLKLSTKVSSKAPIPAAPRINIAPKTATSDVASSAPTPSSLEPDSRYTSARPPAKATHRLSTTASIQQKSLTVPLPPAKPLKTTANLPPANGFQTLVEAEEMILGRGGLELSAPLTPRRRDFRDDAVFWENTRPDCAVQGGGRGRAAERELMASFIYYPSARSIIRTTLSSLEAEMKESGETVLPLWSIDGHAELWAILTSEEASGETHSVEDFLAVVKTAAAGSAQASTRLGDLLGDFNGKRNLHEVEYVVGEAVLAIRQSVTVARLQEMARNTREIDEERDEQIQLVLAEVSSDVARQQQRFLDLSDEMATKTKYSALAREALDSASLEKYAAQNDYEEDYAILPSHEDAVTSPNPYDFENIGADSVLEEGVLSEDEEFYRRRNKEIEDSSRFRDKRAGPVKGVTFGLDDLYDPPEKPKWQKKR